MHSPTGIVVLVLTLAGFASIGRANSLALTETTEPFDLPRIIEDVEPLGSTKDPLACLDSCGALHDVELHPDPRPAPVAIAPLPPAILTGTGMLLGGALLKLVRRVRMT